MFTLYVGSFSLEIKSYASAHAHAYATIACVTGAGRGRGIREIRRALEHKGRSARAARFLRFARILLPFPLLVPATQAKAASENQAFLLI